LQGGQELERTGREGKKKRRSGDEPFRTEKRRERAFWGGRRWPVV